MRERVELSQGGQRAYFQRQLGDGVATYEKLFEEVEAGNCGGQSGKRVALQAQAAKLTELCNGR